MGFLGRYPILIVFILMVLGLAGYTAKVYLDRQNQQGGGGWGGGSAIVVTQPARVMEIVDKVESIGTARANESVSITSKVTEIVTKVNFEDGSFVAEGQILVELTNSEETAQLAEAQAAVDESTRQFERLQNLIRQNLASETQLDVERARMRTAKARLEAIVARLDDRLIRAPFEGILGFRNVSQGTLLTTNTVVTTLDDIGTIKLDFSIPENFLAAISKGQQIVATSAAYPGREFIGEVRTINSRIDPVTRSVSVRALLDNSERRLKPGMLLAVSLVRNRSTALVVPEEAIIPIQDRHYVYTVTDGKAIQKQVETGRRRPGIVEITAGLEAGQPVITQGVIKVRPGMMVNVRNSSGEPAAQNANSQGAGQAPAASS